MKFSDYVRLAFLGVKSRKKSTRNTVRGIAFGLSMLIPVLFFTLAFYTDLTRTVDRTYSLRTIDLPVAEQVAGEGNAFAMGRDAFENALQKYGAADAVYSQYYSLGSARSFTWKLGEKTVSGGSIYTFSLDSYGILFVPFRSVLKLVDLEKSGGKTVPRGLLKDMGATSALIAGEGFSGKGGEVLLSEPFLREFGINDAQTAVGMPFSVTATGNLLLGGDAQGFYLDDNDDPADEFVPQNGSRLFTADILHEFTVCGVIGEAYYALNSLTLQDAHVWISAENPFAPTISQDGEKRIVTYRDDIAALSDSAAARKAFFPAVPAVRYARYGMEDTVETAYAHTMPVTTACIQCQTFDDATKFLSAFETSRGGTELAFLLSANLGITVAGFGNLRLLNTVCTYIILVMLTFGGVVMIATLLNLFHSVNYSAQVRKQYMGMLQAIGARRSTVPKLYFFEIMLIFALAMPWALIFGGGLSYGMKWLVDYFFATEEGKAAATAFTASISLDFYWFFVAFAIVLVFAALCAALFSFIACKGATKKGIVGSLATEQ